MLHAVQKLWAIQFIYVFMYLFIYLFIYLLTLLNVEKYNTYKY